MIINSIVNDLSLQKSSETLAAQVAGVLLSVTLETYHEVGITAMCAFQQATQCDTVIMSSLFNIGKQ